MKEEGRRREKRRTEDDDEIQKVVAKVKEERIRQAGQ